MKISENHILVGVGGTGGKILKAFKKRIFQEYSPEERAELPIGFVYVDSTIEMMKPDDKTWYVLGENAQFTENEFVNIKGIDLNSVFASPASYPGLKGIIGDAEIMKKTLGEVGEAAAQKRRAGRILFGTNIAKYKRAITGQFRKINERSHHARTNIYIFAGLAGGTGSGSIVDIIAQTRMIPEFRSPLSNDGKSGTGIVVSCMVPELTPPGKSDAGRYHANGFAALTELNSLLTKTHNPYDVSGQNERLPIDTLSKVADGLILYSNVNENGIIVDSFNELPQIVSDFTYSRIFLENNDNTQEYCRAYSFENINDWRNELWEKAKPGKVVPYRTKAVSTFGIKRVVIPEEEIIEYFTYSFARQSLLQMRYSNWNDDLGYREIPENRDYRTDVQDSEKLEKWRMTDKHLMLDIPILPSDDGKFGTFAAYWSGNAPRWAETAQQADQPISRLEGMFNKAFAEQFRTLGVKRFFENKSAAREEHANEIAQHVEQYIFNKWKTGDLSLYNMLQFIDTLIEDVNTRRKTFEGKISQVRKAIELLDKEREASATDYSKSIIRATLMKGRLILGHSVIMQKLMMKRTESEALNFAVELTGVLSGKLNKLRNRIEIFVATLNESITQTETLAAARCKDQGGISNLNQTIIRFYNQAEVKDFTNDVIHNKKHQDSISALVRDRIVEIIGSEQTFERANAAIDVETIMQIMETTVREKAISIHDAELKEANEKIINRNILEQLSEKYNSPDDLRLFAKRIIEESGVFLELDETEISRAVTNNAIPEIGQNISRKIVLVNLPKVEGNDRVQAFANRLKDALINSVEGGIEVKVDMNGEHKNEMTVMTIQYCFPIRCLKNLRFYEECYNRLINTPNETQARENRTVLHTEGTGEQFPVLFIAPEKLGSELRKEYMPYIILALAMGKIKHGTLEDGTGRQAYGTIERDDLGFETLSPLADKFTGIGYCEKFTEDFCEEYKEIIEKEFKTTYLNINERQATLIPKVQEIAQKILLPECGGNAGSEEFLFYRAAAMKALELIKG